MELAFQQIGPEAGFNKKEKHIDKIKTKKKNIKNKVYNGKVSFSARDLNTSFIVNLFVLGEW